MEKITPPRVNPHEWLIFIWQLVLIVIILEILLYFWLKMFVPELFENDLSQKNKLIEDISNYLISIK